MYLQSRPAVTDEGVKTISRVCLLLYCCYQHSGCHRLSYPDLLFAKRFAISQHCFHRHRYCFDLSNALWCVGYAVAVTKESYHVSCRLDSRDRYTVLNLGCSIILFPLSPTSFYFAHFVLELILVYIASQLKYRLDDLWFVPSFSDSMNQLLL